MSRGRIVSGVKIYPSIIKRKMDWMNTRLDNLKADVEHEKSTFNEFLKSNDCLAGFGWDSSRRYVREIQLPLLEATLHWIEAQKEGNDRYSAAAAILPRVQCLDKDLLESEEDYWEDELSDERDREHPRQSRIRKCKRMLAEIREKLAAMAQFARTTNQFYDRAMGAQAVLDRADTEIQKVSHNRNTNTLDFTSVDRNWIHEFERLRDIEELKARGLTEEQIKEAEDYGVTPAETLTAWEEMQDRDIKRSDLERMEAQGLGFGVIIQAWNGAKSEDDKILVTGLIKRDYDSAFKANTGEINAVTKMFMTEYILQVSMMEKNSDQELQSIMNAMLKQELDEIHPNIAGHVASTARARAYLEILYAGTTNQLEIESILLLDPNSLDYKTRKELLVRNEKLMALATMGGGAYYILQNEQKPYTGVLDLSDINIDALCYNEATNVYSFNMSLTGVVRKFSNGGETAPEYIDVTHSVSTQILEKPNGVAGQYFQEARAALEAERDALGEQLLSDILVGGISAANPILGAGIQFIGAIAEGEYSDALENGYGALTEIEISDAKINKVVNGTVTESTISGIQAFLSYKQNYDNLSDKIQRADWEQKMTWFGQGGTYNVGGEDKMIVTGIYNPDILAKIGIWESQGFEALVASTVSEESLKNIPKISESGEADFLKSLSDNERILWEGGNILSMNTGEFETAVQGLQEKYQDVSNGYNLDIKELIAR